MNRRALTIYLWQGFGLVAADRLVHGRVPAPLDAVASIAVVLAVIVGAVVLVGPVEDRAASRRAAGPRRRAAAPAAAAVVAVGLVVASLEVGPVSTSALDLPLSGRAVLGRADVITDSLDREPAPSSPAVAAGDVDGVVEEWARDNARLLERLGTGVAEVAAVVPGGEVRSTVWPAGASFDDERFPWWSVTKTITSSWLAESVVDGVVALDDPLSRWVPEAPHGDRITLEHLARHLSGIPNDLEAEFFEASPARDVQAYLDSGRLVAEPGERFEYSRIGYHLLALALERTTWTTWGERVAELAAGSGARLDTDEPDDPDAPVTDPGGHGYTGVLWAAGGIVSTAPDAATLWSWLFGERLGTEEVDLMTTFSADEERWFYGLGLVPLCPCELEGDRPVSDAVGLDSATSTMAVGRRSGAAVVVRSDAWWEDGAPSPAFYDLQVRILEALDPERPGS